jgi:Na+-translocating ferredoxin:NAD+ oxidoreductase subunit G
MSHDSTMPRPTSSATMIVTLGLVAMFSGLAIVSIFQITQPMIAENQRQMVERAVFQVVRPGAIQRRDFSVDAQGLYEGHRTKAIPFYAAYDGEGRLKGIAAQGAAQGYADMVRLLYGYDPNCACIIGFSIIKMAETPGLGDKILTDAHFLANFNALDAHVNGATLRNPIITVKHGSKKHPWEIDAISGATITSHAVGKAIHQSAQNLLPLLWPHREQLAHLSTPSITPAGE